LAAAASATLLWFGTGLHPVAALTWLAPLPVLAVSVRTSTARAAGMAALAWIVSSLNMWNYFHKDIEMPVLPVAGLLALQAAEFVGTVLLYRALVRRDRPGLAVLAAGAAWATGEYLLSLVSPGGAFSSLGYTQAGVLPVIQLASATGVWGVGFALLAVPGAIAAILTARRRWPPVAVGVALVVGMLGYGAWRLHRADDAPTATIALINVSRSVDSLDPTSAEGTSVLDAYLEQLPAVAAAGATVAVLPEKVFRVTGSQLAELGQRLIAVARQTGLIVVIGLTLVDDAGVHNVAMAYSSAQVSRYDKQHLVPGWEDRFTPGTGRTLLPGTAAGLAVCKDLDYPALARDYANSGAGLLLVPALDVDRDGWLHGRMAVVRGVESGTSVVRTAGHGRLNSSDAYGRVGADVTTASGVSTAVATVRSGPTGTLYDRLGDWFAWLCLAATMVLIPLAARRRPAF